MMTERQWRQELEFLIAKLEDERRADHKAFYRRPANPFAENGNARTRFLIETMKTLLPRLEQMAQGD